MAFLDPKTVPVPSQDSADNNYQQDVLGNKTDTIEGDSILAHTKLIKSNHIVCGTSPNTAGTANTAVRIELDSNASAVDGAYDPAVIHIIAGTGIGQARLIFEYDGTNKYAYINRDWKVVPDNTSVYCVIMNPGNTHVNEGLARGGTNDTITLNTLASAQNDLYLGQLVFIVAGPGQDQARMVVGYVGGTKVATVDADWIVNPDNTSVYTMLPYPGFVHGVPTVDSAANVLARDVLGNKGDTHDGDSAMARLDTADEHVHSEQEVYPTLADGVTLTTHADDWVLGTITEVVPATTIGSDFDIHEVVIEDVDTVDKTYELVLYSGAGDTEVGRTRFAASTNKGGVPNVFMQTPIIAADSRIRAQLAIQDGGSKTAVLSIRYHVY